MFARNLVAVGSVSSAGAAGTTSPRSGLVGIGIARAVTTHRMISLFLLTSCSVFGFGFLFSGVGSENGVDVSKRQGVDQCRARGGLRLVAAEPTPAQRKDSVLRREMKGSVLTSCSATHAPKLIIIVQPLNSLILAQRPFRPRFASFRPVLAGFQSLGSERIRWSPSERPESPISACREKRSRPIWRGKNKA